MPRKVVLAYSGGLDTSIIIPWLIENYRCEVIAMIGDLGQQEDLEAARRKALATGASAASIEDLREEFIAGYIWPTLRAGAVYEHKYLLGTSFARPVLAKRQAEIALRIGADALAHGWPREVERHQYTIRRLEQLLLALREPIDGPESND